MEKPIQVPLLLESIRGALAETAASRRGRVAVWVAEQVKHPVSGRLIVRFGQEPEAVIERTARNMNADLLVVGSANFSGWQHLVQGSLVRELVRRVASPILCLNAPKPRVTTAR